MANTVVSTLKNYINGEWVESGSGKQEAVFNPATGEVIAYVPLSTREEVDRAVKAAKQAFETWKNVAVPKRARILFKYQQLIADHADELAALITMENGKNLREAKGEVQRGMENVEFAAGAPSLMMGENLATIASELESSVYRYPGRGDRGDHALQFSDDGSVLDVSDRHCTRQHLYFKAVRADAAYRQPSGGTGGRSGGAQRRSQCCARGT